jgi:HTH-type transcriptional regulator / antitoxin HigA
MASDLETTRADSGDNRYWELLHHLALRPIRSDAELDRAIAAIDAVIDRPELDRDEEDYLDVLSDLVAKYESEQHPIPPASDAEILRFLMTDAKEVTQAKLAVDTGIPESTISEVLSGKRGLSRRNIGILARYFHVSPAVFSFE